MTKRLNSLCIRPSSCCDSEASRAPVHTHRLNTGVATITVGDVQPKQTLILIVLYIGSQAPEYGTLATPHKREKDNDAPFTTTFPEGRLMSCHAAAYSTQRDLIPYRSNLFRKRVYG